MTKRGDTIAREMLHHTDKWLSMPTSITDGDLMMNLERAAEMDFAILLNALQNMGYTPDTQFLCGLYCGHMASYTTLLEIIEKRLDKIGEMDKEEKAEIVYDSILQVVTGLAGVMTIARHLLNQSDL